jgi:hypothetical protein
VASPAALLEEQDTAEKLSFPYRKTKSDRARAKSEKQRKFFCGVASGASGGGAGFLG